MKTQTINHNYKGENYHEVIVKSPFARNTGPQQIFLANHLVKFGMLDKWLETTNHEVVKIFHHIHKN